MAIIAHHPQAVYFGMKSGRLPTERAPDDVIAGSARDATRRRDGLPPEEDPDARRLEDEGQPALAGGGQLPGGA